MRRWMIRIAWVGWVGVALPLAVGCGSMRNYLEAGPVWSGGSALARPHSDVLRIVTFNIKFGIQHRRALAEIQASTVLREADVFLLQEVHEEAVLALADGLGCEYVYHPISRHSKYGENFGNAVLCRGTIHRAWKHLAPHENWRTGQRRGATIAEVTVRGRRIHVASTHTGTAWMGLGRRMQQVEAIGQELDTLTGPILIGGDFNVIHDDENRALTDTFSRVGFEWVSPGATRTASLYLPGLRGTLDLIYGRGVESVESDRVDTDASDHCPVWVDVRIP